MTKHLFCACLLAVSLSQAQAKPVQDATFSVDIPDHWTQSQKGQQQIWGNANNTVALSLATIERGFPDLDTWVSRQKRAYPKASLEVVKLGEVGARRLEYVDSADYRVCIWVAQKGPKTIMINLVSNQHCPEDIPSLRKTLVQSFRWR